MVIERWRPRWEITPWRLLQELAAPPERLLPRIEIYEKEDKFVVKAELPGMKEEDVDVSVSDDTLTIRGEKTAESEVKEEDYYCSECSYGSFYRSIGLPSNVDTKKIEASYENGVLEVTLPKAAEVKPKKITVVAKKTEETKK